MILNQKYEQETKAALETGFKQLNEQFLSIADEHKLNAGTTAICALILKNMLYVANVGDSRAVLCRGGKAIALSDDHKCTRDDEKKRVEARGGRITSYWGGPRVNGFLNMTRAIGDRELKDVLSAEPEIQQHEIQSGDEFLILASDGVWDVLSNQGACDLLKGCTDMQKGARKITDEAFQRSTDNITAIVIDLQKYL